MQRVDLKKVQWPELTLVVFGLLFVLVLMIRTSSTACHHWKQQMVQLGGAFLAAAGEEEYPQPETGISQERQNLRSVAQRILDQRPAGCL